MFLPYLINHGVRPNGYPVTFLHKTLDIPAHLMYLRVMIENKISFQIAGTQEHMVGYVLDKVIRTTFKDGMEIKSGGAHGNGELIPVTNTYYMVQTKFDGILFVLPSDVKAIL